LRGSWRQHGHAGPCRCCSSTTSSTEGTHRNSGSTQYNEMTEDVNIQDDDVYMSKHFVLRPGDVEKMLRLNNISFKESSEHVNIRECPFCHPIKGKLDNMYKLSVSKQTGAFNCFRCNTRGNWWKLRRKLHGDNSPSAASSCIESVETVATNRFASVEKPVTLTREELESYRHQYVKSYGLRTYMRDIRGINDDVAEKYSVGGGRFKFMENGRWVEQLCFTFPMTTDKGVVVRSKVRALENKAHMQLHPRGGKWGLFGLHTVPDSAKEIILTEGEFDAMAAYQATGIPAVSLPNGASSLPVDILPMLERFDRIYLWMDDDNAGREGAATFTRKLGAKRCAVVKTRGGEDVGPKDANDALREGLDLKQLLEKAGPPTNYSIVRFSDLLEDIYEEVKNPKRISGTQWSSLEGMNEILKGHRRGEFTVVSGHTGVGKTTLVGQYSLDLCMKGVRTLWGSFEINNVRMAKMLLGQYHYMKTGKYLRGKDLTSLDEFREVTEGFSSLPLYFMRFYGSCPTAKVIETMEFANYVLDATHFVLDNLQFMLSGQARGASKFDLQDEAIIEFRKFATSNNSHITLVMHPRKENDEELLQTSSISGSAKATQEADNIILLQRGDRYPFLEVRKNRFDGGVGRLPLSFDRESKVFTQIGTSIDKVVRFNANDFGQSRTGPARSTPKWLQASGQS